MQCCESDLQTVLEEMEEKSFVITRFASSGCDKLAYVDKVDRQDIRNP